MILTFTLLLALSAPSAQASIPKVIPSDAPNCALKEPPESAGEILIQGSVAKVFPRLPDLPPKYKGCQMTWVSVDEEMFLANVVYFKKGRPSIMWSPAGDKLLCKYKKERLTSGPPECPAYEELSVPSMPPGCAEKLSAGSGAESECVHE